MTVIVLMDLIVDADKLDRAASDIEATLVDTRAFDGCLGVEVLVDEADPTHVVLIERWASVAADEAYRAWRAGRPAAPLRLLASTPPTKRRLVDLAA